MRLKYLNYSRQAIYFLQTGWKGTQQRMLTLKFWVKLLPGGVKWRQSTLGFCPSFILNNANEAFIDAYLKHCFIWVFDVYFDRFACQISHSEVWNTMFKYTHACVWENKVGGNFIYHHQPCFHKQLCKQLDPPEHIKSSNDHGPALMAAELSQLPQYESAIVLWYL